MCHDGPTPHEHPPLCSLGPVPLPAGVQACRLCTYSPLGVESIWIVGSALAAACWCIQVSSTPPICCRCEVPQKATPFRRNPPLPLSFFCIPPLVSITYAHVRQNPIIGLALLLPRASYLTDLDDRRRLDLTGHKFQPLQLQQKRTRSFSPDIPRCVPTNLESAETRPDSASPATDRGTHQPSRQPPPLAAAG